NPPSARPTTPTARFHLASIQSIQLNGLDGNDVFIFNAPGGPINVPGGISISGGAGTDNQIIQRPATGISDRKGDIQNPQTSNSFRFSLADPYLNVGTQKMTWSSIQRGDETLMPILASLAPVRDGLGNAASGAFQHGLIDDTDGTAVAAFDLP